MGAPFRDLVFDLDDTLIASFAPYVRLHRRVAAELGWRVPTRAELIPYGPSWPETLRALWPDRPLEPFLARYEQLAAAEPYQAIPGALGAVARLRQAGHRLWILTKRSRLRLDLRLAQARLDPGAFEAIFTLEDQPAPKPDPRCFAPLWAEIGAGQPACYVGDRREDRAAALGAGLAFIAVRTGPEAETGFPGPRPDHRVIASVAELPALLAGWSG